MGGNFTLSASKGCAPLLIKFKASGFSNVLTYTWDFGSGPIGGTAADTLLQAFTTPGKYTVMLTVQMTGGKICTITKKDTFEVLPTPSPVISVSPGRVICNGARKVDFTDKTSGVVSRTWIIEGVTYSNAAATISHTFTTTGKKSVSLQVTNAYGCTGIFNDNQFVEVYDSISTDFCSDISILDTATVAKYNPNIGTISNGRIVSGYLWSFPGGRPSSYLGRTPPPISYRANGPYPATLTLIMKDGCTYTNTKKNYITKFFDVSTDTVCIGKPVTVTFKANSDGRGFYEWTILGGNEDPASSSTKKILTYGTAGAYDVIIAFKYSPNGCKTTVTKPGFVNVIGPKAIFNSPNKSSCYSTDTINLVGSVSQLFGAKNVYYTWHVFDSADREIKKFKMGPTKNPDTFFVPGRGGRFGISLVVSSSNGCRDSAFSSNYINISRPKADFYCDTTVVCMGKKIQFVAKPDPPEDRTTSYKYYWTFTNVDSPQVVYQINEVRNPLFEAVYPGPYNVKMVLLNGKSCGDTIVKTSYIKVLGVRAHLTFSNTNGCLDPSLIVQASARISYKYPNSLDNTLKYEWKVSPDGGVYMTSRYSTTNFIYFTEPGCYTIVFDVTDSKGCITEVEKKDIICAGVSAGFDLKKNKCLGSVSDIFNYSETGIEKYKWYGEPKQYLKFVPSDTVRTPGIVYLKDTCYTVYMVAQKTINGNLCRDTVHARTCMKLPEAIFKSDTTQLYCAPKVASFVNLSLRSKKFIWDFGDGSPPVFADSGRVSHIYFSNNAAGYSVRLIAIDDNGCRDTTVIKNYISITGPEPRFAMNHKTGCDSMTVKFRNTSINVKSMILLYGDGTAVDTTGNSTHFYQIKDAKADSQFYYPVMIVLDSGTSCKAFYTDTVKLYKKPKADFTQSKTGGCLPVKVTFFDRSKGAKAWYWDFDHDGKIDDSTRNPTFTFRSAGHFDVKLIIRNKSGCLDSVIKKRLIEVLPIPHADFKPDIHHFCQKAKVNFTNLTTDEQFYYFDYGDGTQPDTSVIVPHEYYYHPQPNNIDSEIFVVKLYAKNIYGCGDTLSDTIVAYAWPTAGYVADVTSGCAPLKVKFTDTSKYASKMLWDFTNDGKIDASGTTTSFTFGPGFHTVKEIVYSSYGCVDSAVKIHYIRVNVPPKADFLIPDSITCIHGSLKFFDNSVPKANIRKWFWKFNDPDSKKDTSWSQFPSFTFNTIGYHDIMLAVEDDKGCRDTFIKRKAVYIEDTLPAQNSRIDYVTVEGDNQVKVVWAQNSVYDFGSYELSRTDVPNPVKITTKNQDTTFDDIGGAINTAATSYCYILHTRDKCGNLSYPSYTHCTILLKSSVVDYSRVHLSWNPYDGWPNIRRYIVLRKNSGGNFIQVGQATWDDPQFTDSTLCDEEYSYMVEGESSPEGYITKSNIVTVHAPYQYQQAELDMKYATVKDNQSVYVEWTKGDQPNISGYSVERRDGRNGWKDYITTADTFLNDTGVKVNQSPYAYRYRVLDNCGYFSNYSNLSTSIYLQTFIRNDSIGLRWNRYRDWKNGVNHYEVLIRKRGGSFTHTANVNGNDSIYIDPEIHADIDTSYCFKVIAWKQDDSSVTSVSNIACAILPSRIFYPTAFTPNGDTTNDVWKPVAPFIYNQVGNKLLDYTLRIYNRWGELVFESHDINKGWNGNTPQGYPAKMDVYIFKLHAQGLDSRSLNAQGDITLIR